MRAAEIAEILNARRIGDGQWIARCPAHSPDRNPSLKITDAGNKTLIKCWAGCRNVDIVRAAGLTFSDLFVQPLCKTKRRRIKPPPRAPKDPDPGRLLRDEVLARRRIVNYGERLLAADPNDECAWEALHVACYRLAEADWRLDLLEGRRI